MVYFISGHRDFTQLEFNKYYLPILEDILESDKDAQFVVGDYDGVDAMAQNYLRVMLPDTSRLTVYHVGRFPRYVAGTGFNVIGGFGSEEEKAAAMTLVSDKDIMFIKPGRRDSGTAQNIIRRFETIDE